MSNDATLTIRLPTETRARLEKLSEATARTKSWLAVQALEEYLETQLWQVDAIEEGIRAADRGEFATDAEVAAYFKRHEDTVEQARRYCGAGSRSPTSTKSRRSSRAMTR